MSSNFYKLGLSYELNRAIEECGYLEPTKIQENAIPALLQGKDVLGRSHTGTGKTAAFGLPAVEKVDPFNRNPQILILAPTRELDIQIATELRKFSKYKEGVKIVPIYGGESIENQIRLLKRGCSIVVGTPGRVMDHLRRKTLKLNEINMVILDEADEMLNMGFKEDIETILSYMPKNSYQMALFSATMPPAIMSITEQFQNNPVRIEIESAQRTIDTVEQVYYECQRGQKSEALRLLLETKQPKLTMIFTNTKKMVDELVDDLNKHDIKAIGLHGDMKQNVRTRVMEQFKQRNYPILIATDVAARGIDVDDIDLVINYDIPQDPEYYIHRVGRTGRAGKQGQAITLVSGRNQIRFMKDLSRMTQTRISSMPLPSMQEILLNAKQRYIETVLEACSNIDSPTIEIANELLSQGVAIENLVSGLISLSYKPLNIKIKEVKKSTTRHKLKNPVALRLDAGKKQGITPAHLVAGISEATSLTSEALGKIEIKGGYSIVHVEKEYVDVVLNTMQKCRIKGYDLHMTLDEGNGYKVIAKKTRKNAKKTNMTKKRKTRSDR